MTDAHKKLLRKRRAHLRRKRARAAKYPVVVTMWRNV